MRDITRLYIGHSVPYASFRMQRRTGRVPGVPYVLSYDYAFANIPRALFFFSII